MFGKPLLLALAALISSSSVSCQGTALAKECYEFTWSSRDAGCSEAVDVSNPCISGSNYIVSEFPPTREEIEDFTGEGGDNSDAFCGRQNGEACIKYTFYTRDKSRTPMNITRFCGKGIEFNDGSAVLKGCHSQDLPGTQLEVCFCQDGNCNGARRQQQIIYTWFLVTLTVILSAAAATAL